MSKSKPDSVRSCKLCGRSVPRAKSFYMSVQTKEQEHRIRTGFLRKYGYELIETLIGGSIHLTCYRSFIRNTPLTTQKAPYHRRKKYERSKKCNTLSERSNICDDELTSKQSSTIIVEKHENNVDGMTFSPVIGPACIDLTTFDMETSTSNSAIFLQQQQTVIFSYEEILDLYDFGFVDASSRKYGSSFEL